MSDKTVAQEKDLKKECGKGLEYDESAKELLLPLKECEPCITWDDLYKCIRGAKELPEGFSEDDAFFMWRCVKDVNERVNIEVEKWEKEAQTAFFIDI